MTRTLRELQKRGDAAIRDIRLTIDHCQRIRNSINNDLDHHFYPWHHERAAQRKLRQPPE